MQPSASCGINFCVAVIGASDALWDGKQPDGSSDHLTVRWDMTTWHNFEVNGDFFNLGSDGSGPGFDLPAYRQTRYRVPFLLTEWNTGPEKTEAYRATYIGCTACQLLRGKKDEVHPVGDVLRARQRRHDFWPDDRRHHTEAAI
ncbi:hypothetical protein PBP221_84260 (plasmid) [Paraburkholderia sp. 22B1P]|uniref:Uncharacterized protein n=1 Tax=Paraburkholderia largidicola TaxID=3014751 RepID=A0A7I8C2J8_9BURK|nr:hypothetical protein PPGU16_79320 [Paraburkholderia sp. PGU16]BEU28286.1 hypothetical protein PBP221_84260 [Paraburkholderia sp. 22B1P]